MDLMSLVAKLTLDSSDYEKGLKDATEEADSMGGKLKSGFAKAGKMVAGAFAVGTVVNGIKQIVTESVQAYAEYEQLVGGVETLFKDSANIIQDYAANAYKTAGLSANEYMSTVTSFSASLLQSLGGDTQKAAEYADMAVTDMSDNANKMGSDMASIQFAYQGFAKQNYTMLDNLKLGYGGTKQEMERLVEDAEKLNSEFVATRDKNGKLALSYADVVDAIHIVQENMGIAGTTAAEASETISGSINSMKAAWQNFLTGLGDPEADIGELSDKLVESVLTVGANLLPVILRVVQGLLSALVSAVGNGIDFLIGALAGWLEGLFANVEASVTTFIGNVGAWFATLWENIQSVFAGVAGWFGEKFTNAYNAITSVFSGIRDWFSQKFEDAKNAVLQAWSNVKDAFFGIGQNVLMGLWNGIRDKVDWLKNQVKGVVDKIKSWFTGKDALDEASPSKWAKKVGEYVDEGLAIGIEGGGKHVKKAADGIVNTIKDALDYDASVDYQSLINKATQSKQYEQAAALERLRNAKIEGERLGKHYKTTNQWQDYYKDMSFADSALAKSTSATINASSGTSRSTSSKEYTINLMTPDGKVMASWLFNPLADYAKANGTPIINPA